MKKILAQLADHETRIAAFEGSNTPKVASVISGGEKQKTLREIVKGRKLKNGSEKLAVIVGYYEKIDGSLVRKDGLKKEWHDAKIDGVYKTNLLDDAEGSYIRVLPSGECDLTQTGEKFFDRFLENESIESASK